MSDMAVIVSFGIGYVIAGSVLLSAMLSSSGLNMKLEPIKVRSRSARS